MSKFGWLPAMMVGPSGRGKVQDVMTRERHYFRDWSTLIEQLLAMLPGAPPSEDGGSEK